MRLVTDKPFLPATFLWCRYCLKPASFVIVNSVDYIDCLFLSQCQRRQAAIFHFFFIGSFGIIAAGNKKRKAKV
jgi:hypothetical protein